MTVQTQIDWWGVAQVAQALGANTRRLVSLHDADEAREWALRMSHEHTGAAALSYYELAVMLGFNNDAVKETAALEWTQLVRATKELAAAVKTKADAEAAAKAAADQVAAAKQAARRDDPPGEPGVESVV